MVYAVLTNIRILIKNFLKSFQKSNNKFENHYYLNTKIYSINPIGLKEIFPEKGYEYSISTTI